MYQEMVDLKLPCDSEEMQDHYCMYVNAEEYTRVTTGGVICLILMSVVCVAVVVFRDIMKVWTCGGLTDAPLPKPNRQLTTMSASYAAETMKTEQPAPSFQNVQVPMGSPSMGQPMMGMPMMGQPMMQQGMMPMMGQPMPMMR